MEIDRLQENTNVWVLLDNTSDMVKEFWDVDSLEVACEYFGRNILDFEEEYLVETFVDEICIDWDNEDGQVQKELNKIKEIFK